MTDEVFLEELLGAVTVSGYEEEGQAVIRKYMEPLADEVRTDDIGIPYACWVRTGISGS